MGTQEINEPYRRYLRLLGIESLRPGWEGLRQLVRAHILTVPFENVSKLILLGREGAGRFLTLEEFLDGIETYGLGGTCHSCNPFLADLLRAAGYEADLLGADMSRPNVHTCIRVRFDAAEYLVDVGYGGPFREPIRLDRLPHETVEGSDRYVLDRDPRGQGYSLSPTAGGTGGPGYVVHEPPRDREFFTAAMQGSFQPIATFVNNLRICRIFERHSAVLFNRTLTVHTAMGTTATQLSTPSEFAEAIGNQLQMPKCPWEPAIEVLERVTGKQFFDAEFARTLH